MFLLLDDWLSSRTTHDIFRVSNISPIHLVLHFNVRTRLSYVSPKVVMVIANTRDNFQRLVYLGLPTACLFSRFTLGILHPSFENKDRQARHKLVLEQRSYSPSDLPYRICILLQIPVMAAVEHFILPRFQPIVPKPPAAILLGYIHVRKYGCDQLERKYFRG